MADNENALVVSSALHHTPTLFTPKPKAAPACPQVLGLGIEVALQIVVTRNLVLFATLFVQARPILAVPGQNSHARLSEARRSRA